MIFWYRQKLISSDFYTGVLATQKRCAVNTNITVKNVAANRKHTSGNFVFLKFFNDSLALDVVDDLFQLKVICEYRH